MSANTTCVKTIPCRYISKECLKKSPFVLDRIWKNYEQFAKENGLCVVKVSRQPTQRSDLHILLENPLRFKAVSITTGTWDGEEDTVRFVLIQMENGVHMFEYKEFIRLTGEDPLFF